MDTDKHGFLTGGSGGNGENKGVYANCTNLREFFNRRWTRMNADFEQEFTANLFSHYFNREVANDCARYVTVDFGRAAFAVVAEFYHEYDGYQDAILGVHAQRHRHRH